MLVSHKIDHDNKVIISTFAPAEVRLEYFLESFCKYQEELSYLPDFQIYNELIDFRPITSFNISLADLKKITSLNSPKNTLNIATKMALLVSTTSAFSLAKVYEMIKNFNPISKKQVKVFSDKDSALQWLDRH